MEKLYFVKVVNETRYRWKGVTKPFLEKYHFGAGDILYANSSEVEKLPMRGRVPNTMLFPNQSLGVVATNGNLYFRSEGGILWKTISNEKQLKSLVTSEKNISRDVDPFWFGMVYSTGGHYVPNVFFEGSLIKMSGQRQVYIALNDSKHPINSVDTFLRHGWDFEQVIEMRYESDMKILPTGLDLD